MSASEAKYVEAFPRFDLIHALSRTGRERPICSFVKENGNAIGEAFLIAVFGEAVLLAYVFVGTRIESGPGVVRLSTATVGNGVDKGRRYFLCPDCEKRVGTLVFTRSWACRSCHRLVHRVQLIGEDVAAWEEMNELRARLDFGRPHGMWQKTYARNRSRDRRRLAKLQKRFGRVRKFASNEHLYRVDPERRSIEETNELMHPHYVIAGGKIVTRGEEV